MFSGYEEDQELYDTPDSNRQPDPWYYEDENPQEGKTKMECSMIKSCGMRFRKGPSACIGCRVDRSVEEAQAAVNRMCMGEGDPDDESPDDEEPRTYEVTVEYTRTYHATKTFTVTADDEMSAEDVAAEQAMDCIDDPDIDWELDTESEDASADEVHEI